MLDVGVIPTLMIIYGVVSLMVEQLSVGRRWSSSLNTPCTGVRVRRPDTKHSYLNSSKINQDTKVHRVSCRKLYDYAILWLCTRKSYS